MIKELWQNFPRLIEEKINALLDEAEPSQAKAFQLYKTCQQENLWSESFEKFSEHLDHFFALPKHDRRKSELDRLLDRPMHSSVFAGFHLNFRTASVSSRSVAGLANWAHNLMRVGYKTDSAVISMDVLTKTLHYITHPPFFEKAENIEFEDFCAAWKKTVFGLFGKKYDAELDKIVSELRWLQTQIKNEEKALQKSGFVPTIYLTQTEIDWTEAVLRAVSDNTDIPKYPLSKGPQKQRLVDLVRTISLYKIVQTTKLPEFIEHRDKIRATIIDRCEKLLNECAR
ncbi:hypothetical protein EZJ49_12775 [Bdellovibrio bacteriovorus]|uniref:hypothetical protein n=1 Tax=Bdellovibrio bacteriovorus TaxID=959 RepID=UPI0021D181D0|nr:hypothetical protein [Bdellovibrio bacteriovorus]UXR63939.1 hypothetical protein EZJ49_12775 [Bdellovibrio bacteriovorus]